MPPVPRSKVAEVGATQGLGHRVGCPPAGADVHHRQAATIDRHAVAEPCAFSQQPGLDHQPRHSLRRNQRRHPPRALNKSREHDPNKLQHVDLSSYLPIMPVPAVLSA